MARSEDTAEFLRRFYPEICAGGFTSIDGTIEFYSRINALLDEDMVVLDFGAGRAAWFEDDKCLYRKSLRTIKGKVCKVIACDIDSVVLENRSVDETRTCRIGDPLNLTTASVDIIIADYVFEHVSDPSWLSKEFHRILKPGGWICARTPTKYNYVAIAARLLPNKLHRTALQKVQPNRKSQDVFPTTYKLNTITAIRRAFPIEYFDHGTYHYSAEPAYHFNQTLFFQVMRVLTWLLPKPLHGNLYVFLKKRAVRDSDSSNSLGSK